MNKLLASMSGLALALCGASAVAGDVPHPETFFIRANPSGHDATIKVPVGAVASFSATSAEALNNYGDPEVEAMRLSGDVRIDVMGSGAPIEIKADRVVLELTADAVSRPKGVPPLSGSRQVRSRRIIEDGGDRQSFVGNVVFTLQTSSGALQITADRVDHTDRLSDRVQRREGV